MKWNEKLNKVAFVLLLTLSCSCDRGDEEAIPSDRLTIYAIVDGSNLGQVEFIISAPRAKEFSIIPGESLDTLFNSSGVFNYVYEKSGKYEILASATLESGIILSDSIELSISISINPSTLGNQVPTEGYDVPDSYPGYSLVWSDEFINDKLDQSSWNYEVGNIDPFGNAGWGNNELQVYREENASVQDGYLTLEVLRESNDSYTSARVNTRNKKKFKYGRIDIRAALPNQRGMWPAIWMLGKNHLDVGWPNCGEIDIMEAFISGSETANQIKSNAFWGTSFPAANAPSPPFKLPQGDFSKEWHVFSLEWDANSLRFFVDEKQHYMLTINEELGAHFRNEFFFILNVAVGGNPVPAPDENTVFPQRMFVDFIRVYQKD